MNCFIKFKEFLIHKKIIHKNYYNYVIICFIKSIHCIKSLRICPYSVRMWENLFVICPYSVQMWENADQNNSEYEHFSPSDYLMCKFSGNQKSIEYWLFYHQHKILMRKRFMFHILFMKLSNNIFQSNAEL